MGRQHVVDAPGLAGLGFFCSLQPSDSVNLPFPLQLSTGALRHGAP
jgi:hypothetical protein